MVGYMENLNNCYQTANYGSWICNIPMVKETLIVIIIILAIIIYILIIMIVYDPLNLIKKLEDSKT